MKSVDIIRSARVQLKEFIAYEAQMLYVKIHGQNPDFSKDEEYVITKEDLKGHTALVELEDDVYEVERIKVALDGNVFLDLLDDDSWEYEWNDLETDTLYTLAYNLEAVYTNQN